MTVNEFWDKANNDETEDCEFVTDWFITNYDNGTLMSDENIDIWVELCDEIYWENFFECVDTVVGESRRWSKWVDKIFKIKNRYFSFGCDEGLTELQENEVYLDMVREVTPLERVISITEWRNVGN